MALPGVVLVRLEAGAAGTPAGLVGPGLVDQGVPVDLEAWWVHQVAP